MDTYDFLMPDGRVVSFHYCDDEAEAMERFQARYGYWPSEPVRTYPTV